MRLEYRPISNLHLIVSRNNYATLGPENNTERAAVNGFGAWGNFDGLQMYGSMNQSTTSFGKSTALLFGSRKDLTSRIGVGFDYLSSSYSKFSSTRSFVGTIREVISPRLSLTRTHHPFRRTDERIVWGRAGLQLGKRERGIRNALFPIFSAGNPAISAGHAGWPPLSDAPWSSTQLCNAGLRHWSHPL